ncbi:MAG: alpha/beta hydrolase [Gammaproteobacteria bacterium]|nr:alpha/beta hydrolase [Gammaproteobacteria bacterium]
MRLTRVLTVILLSASVLYGMLCLAMFLGQRSLLYHPTPTTPQGDPAIAMDLAVVGAVVKVSVREREGRNALIYFGGNAEQVSYNLPAFEIAFPNHAIYMLHYRGYNGSGGAPTEAALHADAKVLFEWVEAKHTAITLVGRSLGSGVAVRLAATNKVQHLVLITPYDSISNVAKVRYPWLPVGLLLQDTFDSARYAPRITAPTVIVAGEYDLVIPPARTAALYTAFMPGIATLKNVPRADHNSISAVSNYYDLMDIE